MVEWNFFFFAVGGGGVQGCAGEWCTALVSVVPRLKTTPTDPYRPCCIRREYQVSGFFLPFSFNFFFFSLL